MVDFFDPERYGDSLAKEVFMNKSEAFHESLRVPTEREISIEEVLTRGVNKIAPEEDTLRREMEDRRVKIYTGYDPTSPELHLGHTVSLRKLRNFQDLGHEVVALFGTFTAQIGDPTDKSASRSRLTPEQVDHNVATYAEQAGKILDMSETAQNPVAIMYNHEWLAKLSLAEFLDLAANFTVADLEHRSMFDERRAKNLPINLIEYIYPLMQGYDSVAMGVDVEMGGKDQLFNMLTGRTLVNRYLNKEKWCIATKLIEDPNGKKMGKTEGNIVNINDWSEVKFEAIMTWPDSAIPMGFELLTTLPMDQVAQVQQMLTSNEVNPLHLKESLAYRVVAELDGVSEADFARNEFDAVMRRKQEPSRLREATAEVGMQIAQLLVASGLTKTDEEAQMLLKKGSIFLDGKQVGRDFTWDREEGVLGIGKKSIKNKRRVVRG